MYRNKTGFLQASESLATAERQEGRENGRMIGDGPMVHEVPNAEKG